jgi:D-alanine-D-alanine ligase
MSSPLRVAVVFGGRSAEHEISLLSARFVVRSLDPARFEPVLVGIDKEGRFQLAESAALLLEERDPRLLALREAAEVHLARGPAGEGGAAGLVVASGEARPIDVVFPVLHGPMGEDGTLQGMLEVLGLPYVGSGVLASAVGMDKAMMKRLLVDAGLPVLPWASLRAHDVARDPEGALARVLGRVGRDAPCWFVKPANLGSSVGVSKVRDEAALLPAVREALRYDDKIVVERGIEAPRELECAVLGDEEPEASIVGEIEVDHPDGFYSYAAKYLDERGATLRIPARVTEARALELRELAKRTFVALDASGLGRIDFLVDPRSDEVWVNEINTMPGFTAVSMYPKLWEASGLDARALVSRLLELALARHARRRALLVGGARESG